MIAQNKVINLYERFLEKSLTKNHVFSSLSSPTMDFSTKTFEFSTVFSNAIILQCLNESKTETSNLISKKIVKFLLSQKTKMCTFNYWDNKSKEYEEIPYPDDLDDTSCALHALSKFDKKLLTGSDLKKILETLINQEVDEGGPYFTWIVSNDDIEWKDIDLAVNSNIANLLSLFEIELPNLVHYVENAIVNNKIKSRYYPTSVPVAYFISRWYRGSKKKELVKSLMRMYEKKSSTIMDKILIATSLLRLGETDNKCVSETVMMISRKPSIVFEPFPFYRGVNPTDDKLIYFAGSKYLTTAFAIELLTLCSHKSVNDSNVSSNNKYLASLNERVFNEVAAELECTGGAISDFGSKRLRLLKQNPDMAMINCIPYITYKSLGRHRVISNKILHSLSKATLYGWLAYDIYDDFFDNQAEAHNLSIANFALRELTSIFTSDYLPKKFHRFFHETMNIVDNANSQEALIPPIRMSHDSIMINDRIAKISKTLGQPENKSIGHVLPIVAVYVLSGRSIDHVDVKNVIDFFKHYLAARQIIDDMHDWEEDLRAGKVNTVSSLLIKNCYQRKLNNISINELRKLFWYKIVVKSCKLASMHLNKAVKTQAPFQDIIEPLQTAIYLTLSEHKRAKEFLLA